MAMKGLEGFDNDSLAWLRWHFREFPEDTVRSERESPGFITRVHEELAKREGSGPELLPKHLRREGKR